MVSDGWFRVAGGNGVFVFDYDMGFNTRNSAAYHRESKVKSILSVFTDTCSIQYPPCRAHVIASPNKPEADKRRASSDSSRILPSIIGSSLRRQHEDTPIATAPYTPSHTHRTAIMNAFRVARAARPAFNALRTVQRRGYADVAADKIQLSLALPHQVRSR